MAKGGRGRGRSGGGQQRGGGTATMVRGAGPGTRAPANMADAARSGGAEVQPWGLADAMNAIAARAGLSNPMPRSALDQVPFGPNWALPPQPLDPARPDTGRPEPRVFEYPVAFNIPGNGNRPIPWDTLYAASTNVDIVRRCIEIRKRHLRGMEWGFSVTEEAIAEALLGDPAAGRMDVETKLREQYLPEIRRATEFWRKPWKANGLSFGQWLNGWMDQHLVLDGVAVYPRTTYGGDVTDLEIIDASTIKLLLDNRGARPEHPFPAFQQELYGFPRGEFTVSVGEDGMMHGGYAADQLYYHRENFRPQTPYGFSAVEQCLISARLYLKRQGWMLAEYDDGSTPLMWLVPAPTAEMWSQMDADQRRRWERSLNDEMAGNQGGRHRVKVTPPGFQPIAMPSVDERYKPEYDLFLIKMSAGFFNVTVAELGLTEPKGLGSSGYHEGQEAVEGRVGQRPDTVMVAESINDLSYDFLRLPREIEFKFIDPQADDEKTKAEVAGMRRARGTITLNDERREIGMAPLPFKEADMPMLLAGDKATPLEGLAKVLELAQQAQQASLEASNAQMEADGETADLEAEELEGASAEKALEMASYRRWARKRGGRAGRMFICKTLAPSDWPGEQVPADVDFEHWEWVPDDAEIVKAFGGNDNWRTLARDHRGRWLPRGRMRVDPLGPATPGKEVLSGLQREAAARRGVSTGSHSTSVDVPTSVDSMTTTKPMSQQRAAKVGADRITVSLRRGTSNTAEVKVNGTVERSVYVEDGAAMDAVLAAEVSSRGTPTRGERGPDEGQRMAAETRRANADMTDEELSASRRRFGRRDGKLAVEEEGPRDKAERLAREREAADPMGEAARLDRVAEGWERALRTPGDGTRDAMARNNAEHARSEAARIRAAHTAPSPSAPSAESARAAYAELTAANGGNPVALTELRAKLGGTREQQDAVLGALAGSPDVAFFPEENQKVRTAADDAAALHIGGENKDLISIDSPREQATPLRGDDDLLDEIEAMGSNVSGGYVSLAALRRKMGGTRAEQDAALKRLDRARVIILDPDPNRKALTQEARDAAMEIGGEPKHLVSILNRPSRQAPAETSQQAAARIAADTARRVEENRRASLMLDHPVFKPGGDTSENIADYIRQRGAQYGGALDGNQLGLSGVDSRKVDLAIAQGRVIEIPRKHSMDRTYYRAATPEEVAAHDARAALSNTPARSLILPEGMDAKDRERYAVMGERADAAHPQIFADSRNTLEGDIQRERSALADPAVDGREREHREARLANLEALLAAPRGDAAVQATKPARELVEAAEAKGMVVLIQHNSASDGAPYFTVQGLDPTTKSGFTATFHTFKGKNGSYGLQAADTIKDGRRTKATSAKALREHVDGIGAPKVDPEVRAAELGASRNVDPSMKVSRDEVQVGDWRWNDGLGEWQQIGMIADRPDAVGNRTIWAMDRETRLGAIQRDSPTIIARQAERPTLPPRAAGLKGLQRPAGEAAKRGDVYVAERKDTTYYGGSSGLRNPRMSYEVYEVTSVGRDGKVRKVRRLTDGPDGYEQTLDQFGGLGSRLGYGKTSVIPGDRIDREGLRADLRAHTYDGYDSPKHHDDLRELGNVLYGRMKPETPAEPKVTKPRKPKPQASEGPRDKAERLAREREAADPLGEAARLDAAAARWDRAAETGRRGGDRSRDNGMAEANAEYARREAARIRSEHAAPSAQSVNDAMAAQMAAQLANPSVHGAAHGKVGPSGLRKGMRVQHSGTAWEVMEEPRKARPDAQGRTGVVFRAKREDQGIESTMRLNDGFTIALAAPKPGSR